MRYNRQATQPGDYKSALGATDSVNWVYYENTIDSIKELKLKNYKVFAIEQADESISLEDFKPVKDEKYALIFGNEIRGVGEELIEQVDGSLNTTIWNKTFI